MTENEHVLVFEEKYRDKAGVFTPFESFSNTSGFIRALFEKSIVGFQPRDRVEQDPSFKQLIPYNLLTIADKDSVAFLSYCRGKTSVEKRLVGQRSLGIGGHINPIDIVSKNEMGKWRINPLTILACSYREIKEEVGDLPWNDISDGSIIGLIEDDSNAVGMVHCGIVLLWRLPTSVRAYAAESAIQDLRWVHPDEIRDNWEQYESWSQIAFSLWEKHRK
jgi:predicted NUDIX family phosphoesterase